MIDANYIKSILTIDDVIGIMSELGADYNFQSSSEIHFRSICHNSESFKLYYYDNSKSFFCHRCSEHWDIFALVEKINNVSFIDAINFVCDICHLETTVQHSQVSIDNWQADLKKFLPNYESQEELKIYDPSVLKLLDTIYHQSWLDDGISKSSMDKFNIRFYSRRNQIAIPVSYEHNLIGIRIRAIADWDKQKGKYRPLIDINDNVYKFPTSAVFYGWDENKDTIKQDGVAWLCEGEKTVMKFDTWGFHNALAVFGSKISKSHINKLLSLGVHTVVLMMDSDYHTVGDDEYRLFIDKMKKNIAKLKPYFNVEVVYNNIGADAYKFSPTDYSRNDFDRIYKGRIKV